MASNLSNSKYRYDFVVATINRASTGLFWLFPQRSRDPLSTSTLSLIPTANPFKSTTTF